MGTSRPVALRSLIVLTLNNAPTSSAMGHLVYNENPVNRAKVRESEIPLDVIYNKELNAMKHNERLHNLHQRPISFSILKNFDGK